MEASRPLLVSEVMDGLCLVLDPFFWEKSEWHHIEWTEACRPFLFLEMWITTSQICTHSNHSGCLCWINHSGFRGVLSCCWFICIRGKFTCHCFYDTAATEKHRKAIQGQLVTSPHIVVCGKPTCPCLPAAWITSRVNPYMHTHSQLKSFMCWLKQFVSTSTKVQQLIKTARSLSNVAV